ncbi:hypothetical protein [Roseateles violae]|uniref:Lipoprotein n=1 Tax=Roseateles violae TaxID=3058042 RepID=A0ABT8DUG7_9BURK|nr:hypothetical protein [Pelomonas sp. PFR6]MDN3921832.1 hypothetical protein [Pelomonas sp. PFR6]
MPARPLTSLSALAAALGLAACANISAPADGIAAVPASQVLDARLTTPQAGYGKIVVKRGEGMAIAGCASRVFVDAKAVAELWPAQKVEVFLPPGNYTIAAHPGNSCGGKLIEAGAKVTAGGELKFKASGAGAFSFGPESI